MTRERDGALLCRARITTVAVDMATMNKQPIPAKWRTAFEAFRIDEADYPSGS